MPSFAVSLVGTFSADPFSFHPYSDLMWHHPCQPEDFLVHLIQHPALSQCLHSALTSRGTLIHTSMLPLRVLCERLGS